MIDAVLPLIVLISLGVWLARSGFLDEARRSAIDALLFFVLMPAFIVARLGNAVIEPHVVVDLLVLVTLLVAFTGLVVLGLRPWIVRALGGISGATFTSLLQGVIRNNIFIPFAIAEAGGLGIGALLAMATTLNLLPATGLSVLALGRYGDFGSKTARPGWWRILLTNPLILAALIGGAISFSGLGLAKPVHAALDMLGDAVLGLALVAVGAGLRFHGMPRAKIGIVLSAVVKLLIMPGMAWILAILLEVGDQTLAAVILLHAAPTAAGSFILARQLGGDAETMATIITAQTLACLFTMPAIYWLSGLPL